MKSIQQHSDRIPCQEEFVLKDLNTWKILDKGALRGHDNLENKTSCSQLFRES